MKNIFLFLGCYFMLIIEGMFVKWTIPHINVDMILVLHITIMFIFYVTMLHDRNIGILLALLFGFFTDIVHYGIIGVYTFVYPVCIWRISDMFNKMNFGKNAFIIGSVVLVILTELWAFFIYRLLNITTMGILPFLQNRLLVTVVLNLIVIVLIHFPVCKILLKKDKPSYGIIGKQ